MLAAFQAAKRPVVLIGTDCPVLAPADLHEAATALCDGTDVVMAPAEDGGYGLIGARGAFPCLFENIPWSTDKVAALTSERAQHAGLRLRLLRQVWDVDTPADVERLARSNLLKVIGEPGPV